MNEAPRVLQIITLFSIGGATETVVSLSRGLVQQGYHVEIVTGPHVSSEGDMMPTAERLGLKVTTLPVLRRAIHPVLDLRALLRLISIIRKGRFDIVHTHSSKAGFLGRIAGLLAGVPVRVHTIHGLSFHEHQSSLTKYMFVWLERFTATVTTALIAVSEHIRREYRRYGIGRENQYSIIRSGIDVSLYHADVQPPAEARARLGFGAGDLVVGKISRLSPLKGHMELLGIFPELRKEFPQLKLLFVGDGEIRKQVEDEVARLGLGREVVLTGSVDPSEIPGLLSLMDMVVHTSYHEGGPRVLPQMLLMGKPVICYATGLSSELIRPGVNGEVITSLDSASLIAAFRKVVPRYGEYRKNCVRDIPLVAHEFSEEKMVADVSALYQRLLATS
jgi:glycosyltransferase involved in cell wall biosynthesis